MGTLSIMLILMLVGAYISATAEPPQNVSGDLHSPLNLTTSFSPNDVKEVSWKCEINGKEKLIVTIKNGSFVDDHEGYGQFGKGAVLEINNLTEKDQGLYIADVTFVNNTMKKEIFNVTVCGNMDPRERKPTTSNPSQVLPTHFDYMKKTKCYLLAIISMFVVVLAVGLPLVVWKMKKSTETEKYNL